MTAIVMNTLNLAVTEYDWAFQSITPLRAGDVTGLYRLTGDTDAGVPIAARAMLPATEQGTSLKKGVGDVYLSLQGPRGSAGELLVQTVTLDDEGAAQRDEYAYPVVLRAAGVTRGTPGKGIRASLLAVGYANVDGAAFRLDRLEADVTESKNHRRLN